MHFFFFFLRKNSFAKESFKTIHSLTWLELITRGNDYSNNILPYLTRCYLEIVARIRFFFIFSLLGQTNDFSLNYLTIFFYFTLPLQIISEAAFPILS